VNIVRRRFLEGLLRIFDQTLQTLSFAFTTMLVVYADGHISLRDFFSIRVSILNCVLFGLILFAWSLTFSLCGLYQSGQESRWETANIFKATTFATAILFIIAAATNIRFITNPRFVVLFWAISSNLLTCSRLLLHHVLLKLRRNERNLRHVLILGSNQRAIEFARKIRARPEQGTIVLGFVDSFWQGTDDFRHSGFPLVCDLSELESYLRDNVVDEVAMFFPLRSFYEHASHVAALCQQHGIMLRFDPDVFDLKSTHWNAEEFEGAYHVCTEAHDSFAMVIKRVIDIVASFALLALLSPVFLAVAIAISLTSEGKVIFSQERIGMNKRRFKIYKFRTMIPGAEKMMAQLEAQNEMDGPVFKIKSDPRITKTGRFLRRTSLDELPQLFNVLIGDMSLVGPRPLPVRDFQGFNEDWQRRRFSVRPGITCLWQINGRNSITFEEWMQLDIQYLDRWSLWLDFEILARTIPAVLKGSGAA
jgi:exopolysaccharide biosynthesis polyprenyl glycosylphosphotransferase